MGPWMNRRRLMVRESDLLGGTEILAEEDCWALVAARSVGRLAVSLDGLIEIFPVNYGLDGEDVVFRTNAGRKMSWSRSGEVAFEVDWFDEESHTGWSVVIHGTARDISRLNCPERPLAAEAWTGPKDFLVRINARTISGRRVSRRIVGATQEDPAVDGKR